jgi:hypothetical protein
MKDPASFYFWLGVIVLLTTFNSAWLWFMVKRPDKWSAVVDKESAFWVRLGLMSGAFAVRYKSWGKRLPMKLMVGVIVMIGTSATLFFSGFALRCLWLQK